MRFTPNKYFRVALALVAFAVAGAAPAFAQSPGAWSAGISTRNARPYVESPSTRLFPLCDHPQPHRLGLELQDWFS